MTEPFFSGPWRNARRFGVGMIAQLLRDLVDQAKQLEHDYDFDELDAAVLSVRIFAAGGRHRERQASSSKDHTNVSRRCVERILGHAEFRSLMSRSPIARPAHLLAHTLSLASYYLSGEVDLMTIEAKWRILDWTDGRNLPKPELPAFEAAWLAGDHRFAIETILRRYLRSRVGKDWIESEPAVVLDEPLDRLTLARRAIETRTDSRVRWAFDAARKVDSVIGLIEGGDVSSATEILRSFANALRAGSHTSKNQVEP